MADDHTIIRKGVRQILTQAYPHAEIEEIEEGEEWAEQLRGEPWDMIISDLPGPDRGGWKALQRVRRDYPGLPVLILSLYSRENDMLRDLNAGVSGCKDASSDELIWAVRQILSGKGCHSVPSDQN